MIHNILGPCRRTTLRHHRGAAPAAVVGAAMGLGVRSASIGSTKIQWLLEWRSCLHLPPQYWSPARVLGTAEGCLLRWQQQQPYHRLPPFLG